MDLKQRTQEAGRMLMLLLFAVAVAVVIQATFEVLEEPILWFWSFVGAI